MTVSPGGLPTRNCHGTR